MKRNSSLHGARFRWMAIRGSIFVLAVLMAGCAATPPAVPPAAPPVTASEDAGPLPTLAYYQMLQRMTPAQVNRERMVLAALPPTPNTQLRTAMVLGHPRGQQDFTKALALLEGVLKSTDPGSVSLHPLARLLADNYSERQKLETQLEKQGQQLKDSQRKTVELQEKIDELADIERTLPQRPRATRPAGGTR
ncbi:MAG: permease [Azonexus sp.]